MDVEHKYEDFVAVQEHDVVQKPSLKFLDFSLEFQLNYDLLIEAPIGNQVNLVDSIAIAGGIYIILTTVTAYILSWFYPYFMQLFIIRNLFKVDNGANKKRQSQQKMENKNHKDLVQEARDAHKKRARLSNNACDRCLFVFESVLRILTCGMNKWSRIVNEGVR